MSVDSDTGVPRTKRASGPGAWEKEYREKIRKLGRDRLVEDRLPLHWAPELGVSHWPFCGG